MLEYQRQAPSEWKRYPISSNNSNYVLDSCNVGERIILTFLEISSMRYLAYNIIVTLAMEMKQSDLVDVLLIFVERTVASTGRSGVSSRAPGRSCLVSLGSRRPLHGLLLTPLPCSLRVTDYRLRARCFKGVHKEERVSTC